MGVGETSTNSGWGSLIVGFVGMVVVVVGGSLVLSLPKILSIMSIIGSITGENIVGVSVGVGNGSGVGVTLTSGGVVGVADLITIGVDVGISILEDPVGSGWFVGLVITPLSWVMIGVGTVVVRGDELGMVWNDVGSDTGCVGLRAEPAVGTIEVGNGTVVGF